MKSVLLILCVAAMPLAARATDTPAGKGEVERGQYLVNAMGCHDCHTPKKMGPHGPEPDMSRMLSGHPEAAKLSPPPTLNASWIAATNPDLTAWAGPWGISYAINLTPDGNTGIGIWTEDMFFKAMRTGRHMGASRPILPPMPWPNVGGLTDADLKAVFAYLKSIPPIKNRIPEAVIAPPPPAPKP